jgi:hypothetical protein
LMNSKERMVVRTGKRTPNTTTCHNMTVRGERGEIERDVYRVSENVVSVVWVLSLTHMV